MFKRSLLLMAVLALSLSGCGVEELPTCDQPAGYIAQTHLGKTCVFFQSETRHTFFFTSYWDDQVENLVYLVKLDEKEFRGGSNATFDSYPFKIEVYTIDETESVASKKKSVEQGLKIIGPVYFRARISN